MQLTVNIAKFIRHSMEYFKLYVNYRNKCTFALKPSRKFRGPTKDDRWEVYGKIFLKAEFNKWVAL